MTHDPGDVRCVSLAEPFFRQAKVAPSKCSIIWASRALSYGELEQCSFAVACSLLDQGVSRGDRVPVVMERGWEQVAAVLGILKIGAAYVPVDPALPELRRAFLLEQIGAGVALTQSRLCECISWPSGLTKLAVDLLDADGVNHTVRERPTEPADLAYIIYTSGSTGLPKGVMVDHRAALNTITDINGRFRIGPSDRVLSVSSLSFDLSVYDIFGLLAAGGIIVMPPHSKTPDPQVWFELVERDSVTIWNSVPALMELLVSYLEARGLKAFNTLQLVLLSGDWIPMSLPDRIRKSFGDIEIVSLGGATEASIWSICHRIGPTNPSWKSVPYGRALRGQSIYVLDGNLDPAVDGASGELYIAGAGLARGYWRDPVKTAAAFLPDPISGLRMYRTGDFGRKMENGEIEFLGRKDQQIKIRGYRIELGEVETTLETHSDVQRAVAFKHEFSPTDQRLLTCVVLRPKSQVSELLLQDFLSERLPSYMVPAAFIFVDAIPVTGNGKVDRRAMSLMVTVDQGDLERLLDSVEQVEEMDVVAQLHQSEALEAQHE